MVAHACNPGIREAEAGGHYEFEAFLAYRARPYLKKQVTNEAS